MDLIVVSAKELADLIKQNVREALAEHVPIPLPSNKPLNAEEAAAYLGLPKPTLYQLTSTRQIPYKKLGKRLVFLVRELDEWIESKHRKTRAETLAGSTCSSKRRSGK